MNGNVTSFENALLERIKIALLKMEAEGIEGFGLNELTLDDEPFGERIRTSGFLFEGCVSGGDYNYKWIPPTGWTLKKLCDDDDDTYYVVEHEKEFHIIKQIDGGHYQGRLCWSSLLEIPDFLLAGFLDNGK